MLVNHPLLMAGDPGEPGMNPLVGSGTGCISSVVSPNSTFNLNPADYITGLQNGDYVLIVCSSSGNTASIMHASGWATYAWCTNSGLTGFRRAVVVGGFWNSASPTTTFTIDRNGTYDMCFNMYAFRGVSRVKPVEHHYAYVTDLGTGNERSSFYWPAFRPHYTGAAGATVFGYAMLEDPGAVSGAYATASETNMVTANTIYDVRWKEVSMGHSYSWVGLARQGELSNVSGTYSDGTHGVRGFTANNITWQEVTSSADMDRYEFYDYGGTRFKYLSCSFSATAGDEISFSVVMKQNINVASSDWQGAMSISDPSGNEYGISLNANRFKNEWDGSFDGRPDYWWAHGSSAQQSLSLHGIGLDAPSTGTYTAKFYSTKEGSGLSWSAGADPATLYLMRTRVNAAGVGINAVPFIEKNSAGSASPFSNDGYVGGAVLKFSGTVSWDPQPNAPIGMLELIPANQTPHPVRFVPYPAAGYLLYDDSNYLDVGGSNQPFGYFPAFPMYADQCVHPTYRTTEAGGDNDGKYYWEITCQEATTSANFILAVLPSGLSIDTDTSTPLSSWFTDECIAQVLGNGEIRGPNYGLLVDFGSVGNGDVISFALDIPAGTCAVYRNGSLQATGNVTAGSHPTQAKRSPYRFVAQLSGATVSDMSPIKANFRGPFVYSKPSGYVAYDFMNELS